MTNRNEIPHDIVQVKLQYHDLFVQATNKEDAIDNHAGFANSIISGFDFSKRDLSYVVFDNCQLVNCVFGDAKLEKSLFKECEITGCDFSDGRYKFVNMVDTSLKNCNISGFSQSTFSNCNIQKCLASSSDYAANENHYRNLNFSRSQIVDCVFDDFQAQECNFNRCAFTNTKFKNSSLARSTFQQAVFTKSTLDFVDLSRSDLSETVFDTTSLDKAIFVDSTGNGYEIRSFYAGTSTQMSKFVYTKNKVYFTELTGTYMNMTDFLNLANDADNIANKFYEQMLQTMEKLEGYDFADSAQDIDKELFIKEMKSFLAKFTKSKAYTNAVKFIKENPVVKRPA